MSDIPLGLDYCPFCGSTSLKIDSKRTAVSPKECRCAVSVRCMKCHARGPVVSVKIPPGQFDERKIYAKAAGNEWNTRYQENEVDRDYDRPNSFFAIIKGE